MSDIRYVCLSDMHLGEEDSLLTNLETASTNTRPMQPSPVMEELVACLRFLISKNENKRKKPTLILLGDILELALSTTHEAAMVFERFVELTMAPRKRLFEGIIYVPGNHDHHLWESGRETQYVDSLGDIKPGLPLPAPLHTTDMFRLGKCAVLPAYFLTRLLQRRQHLKDFVVSIAYPNFGLINTTRDRCVIFHHGHFIEWVYHLMSLLQRIVFPNSPEPRDVETLEEENFAWIDFFWSTMGRSGQVGQGVERIYESLQDTGKLKALVATLAKSLAARYDLPGWGDRMEAWIAREVLQTLVDRYAGSERGRTERLLSDDAERGLWAYLNGPVFAQIMDELRRNMPGEVTFVFGHTHKPFAEDMNFREYPQWVNVYNAGGWVVESVDPQPLHGGSVVLISEDLDATSVRLYNEAGEASQYVVRVEEATHAGAQANPLHRRIAPLVRPAARPWKSFSDAVARAVRVRAQNLRARISER